MNIIEKDMLYFVLLTENNAFLQRQKWWWFHYLNGSLKNQQERLRLRLAAEAEDQVATTIRLLLGYQVYLTTPNCPFDLLIVDDQGRAARAEVKLSYYHPETRGGGRYQADVRQSRDADVLIWIARNGRDWTYIIPMADIVPRRNLAIWSYCPGDYRGQWARYLNAWQHLQEVVAGNQPRTWQLSLTLASRERNGAGR